MPDDEDVTQTLLDIRAGREGAMDRLFAQVYPELKRIARGQLRKLRPGQSLNTTALVHETYFKFADQTRLELTDRGHFYAVAARAMRQVLVDHARRASRKKRGDGIKALQLNEDIGLSSEAIDFERVLQVDQALSKLEHYSSRQAQIVHFRYFVGLKEEEIAELLSVTTRTIRNDWTRAKAWLLEAMRAPDPPPPV